MREIGEKWWWWGAMSTATASSEPLLRAGGASRRNRLAALLERATGRRGASTLVRETAAMQLEERRIHWGYSRPVVALDIVWNLAFAVAAAVTLASTTGERPNVLIRLWVSGYAVQCVVHATLVWVEYRRRTRRRRSIEDGGQEVTDSEGNESEEDEDFRGDSLLGRRRRWAR